MYLLQFIIKKMKITIVIHICLIMIHCRQNTCCTLYYYCYPKTVYLHECGKIESKSAFLPSCVSLFICLSLSFFLFLSPCFSSLSASRGSSRSRLNYWSGITHKQAVIVIIYQTRLSTVIEKGLQ